jgi:hypothetical protein
MPTTVSPEMESALASPSYSPPGARSEDDSLGRPPFDQAQPSIVTPDDVYAHDQMRRIAELSAGDSVAARSQAETEAREWLSEGQSSINLTWLKPIISLEEEEGASFAIESRFGIEVSSLEEAYKIKELRKKLDRPRPVRRAWGVPGLMWALLLDRLQTAQPFHICQRCGRLISGKADKRFCAAADNPACYRERKKEDKRRARSRNG